MGKALCEGQGFVYVLTGNTKYEKIYSISKNDPLVFFLTTASVVSSIKDD